MHFQWQGLNIGTLVTYFCLYALIKNVTEDDAIRYSTDSINKLLIYYLFKNHGCTTSCPYARAGGLGGYEDPQYTKKVHTCLDIQT